MDYKVNYYTVKNTVSDDKPNEDYVFFDEKKALGIVLDGVSRDRENGIYPFPSPAKVATELFAQNIFSQYDSSSTNVLRELYRAISSANSQIESYNKKLDHSFPAGTVGIVFAIKEDAFHCCFLGDCGGMLIRNGRIIQFTECQTENIAKHKSRYTASEIRNDICNNINHPDGYGVWNGSKSADDFLRSRKILLEEGDVIFLYSDGLDNAVMSLEKHQLATADLLEICKIKYAEKEDDKTCIRIEIGGCDEKND